jgi:hypothetical protein
MVGMVFLFTFLGWLVYHLKSIKDFTAATPGLNPIQSIKGYFVNDVWGFIVSTIFLCVLAFFISKGMSDIIGVLLGVPAEFQTERLQLVLAFFVGNNIQMVVEVFTKTNPIDERTLPQSIRKEIDNTENK